jgi:hypothetical protein
MPRKGAWRVGLQAGAVGMGCDYTRVVDNYRYLPYFEVDGAYFLGTWFAPTAYVGAGRMVARDLTAEASNTFVMTGVGTELRWPLARGSFAPFASLRLGALFFQASTKQGEVTTTGASGVTLHYGGSVGLEYVYQRTVGIRVELGGALTLSDELDDLVSEPDDDGFSHFSIGLTYYFQRRGRR